MHYPGQNGKNCCIIYNQHRKQQYQSFSDDISISREVWWMPFDVKHGWASLSDKSFLRHVVTRLWVTKKMKAPLEQPAWFPLLTACQSKVIDSSMTDAVGWRSGSNKELIWYVFVSFFVSFRFFFFEQGVISKGWCFLWSPTSAVGLLTNRDHLLL